MKEFILAYKRQSKLSVKRASRFLPVFLQLSTPTAKLHQGYCCSEPLEKKLSLPGVFKYSCAVFLLGMSFLAFSQTEAEIDSSYANWYYLQRMDFYEKLPAKKHDIVFLGNSITERGEWSELIPGRRVANRGIGGDNTFGVLARLNNIVALQPQKIFLLIGINDLGRGLPVSVISGNYARIVRELKRQLPKSSIYVQSVLPLNEAILDYPYLKGKKEVLDRLNEEIRTLAAEENLPYIDLHEEFADESGSLKTEWTVDGIHLKPVAYVYWVDFLRRKGVL